MYTDRPGPKTVGDLPDSDDLNAMREACLASQNTRRDRAFLELAAGTAQRVYALVTLKIGDVKLEGSELLPHPHVLLNPTIAGNGDKGAIKRAGRPRPIVSDVGPIREWLHNHPLKDPDVRAEVGAPESFEDCFLFVGSLRQEHTNASDHWSTSAARNMLERRKADTESLSGVETVACPVNPHAWRGYAYTKSKPLDIPESDRRAIFGWSPGSDTGDKNYLEANTAEAAKRFAEAWRDEYGDLSNEAAAIDEQVVGEIVGDDEIPPEVRRKFFEKFMQDDVLMRELGEKLAAVGAD